MGLVEGGALAVSVDEKPLLHVFNGMKTGHEKFIPAVYLYNTASIEFLGFQEVHK
jgi:hypothetical protein